MSASLGFTPPDFTDFTPTIEEMPLDDDGGGYALTGIGIVLCISCGHFLGDSTLAVIANVEDPFLYCDSCGTRIPEQKPWEVSAVTADDDAGLDEK